MDGLLKTQSQHQLSGSSMESWGRALQKAVYSLNQCPVYGMSSSWVRICGFRVSARKGSISSPTRTFLLPVPMTFSFASLNVLVPEWGALLTGATTNIPLNWKLRFLPGHSELLMPLSQQVKIKEQQCQEGWWTRIPRGNWIASPHGGKEDYAWSAGDFLGCLLVLPCPVIEANGNYSNLTQKGWQRAQTHQEKRPPAG